MTILLIKISPFTEAIQVLVVRIPTRYNRIYTTKYPYRQKYYLYHATAATVTPAQANAQINLSSWYMYLTGT